MANTQVNITKNGTTTLATAGKYCDRNIDVNVNVAGGGTGDSQPTQFTNYYIPENVVIDKYTYASSSGGWVTTNDSECNYLRINYHHKANTPFVLRMRGISPVRSRMAFICADTNGDGINYLMNGQMSTYFQISYDEYGDAIIEGISSMVTKEFYTFFFNFQYTGLNSATTALTGPIVTINEPIGNGGYAG